MVCAIESCQLTHASIPAMIALVALASQSLRIAGLEILSSWWLHVYHGIVAPAWGVRWTKSTVEVR